jgi:hypothetical protein
MRELRVVCILFGALIACGGDESPPPPKAKKAAQSEEAAPVVKGKGKTATLTVYRKIEDVVSDDERAEIRRVFTESDFAPDPSGTDNRDPFHSYVITQAGIGSGDPGAIQVEATKVCPVDKQQARDAGVNELALIGIVSQGTVRYALFSDTRGEGHIVHRGDCLGREKSRVKEIGAGFVTLEISPEPVPNQPPRPAEERSIPLYPEMFGEGGEDESSRDTRESVPQIDPTTVPLPVTPTPRPPPTSPENPNRH